MRPLQPCLRCWSRPAFAPSRFILAIWSSPARWDPALLIAVLHVDPVTGVRTVISTLEDPDKFPTGIAIDANGDLIVIEAAALSPRGQTPPIDIDILRIDPATGAQSVVATFPAGTGAVPNTLGGIAIDASGDLIVTDVGRSTIYRVDPDTGATAPLVEGQFGGVTVDANGDLLVTNSPPRPRRICVGGSNAGNTCRYRFNCPDGRCPVPVQPDDQILRVDPVTGSTEILVSNAGNVALSGLAVDAYGDVFVLHESRAPILRIDLVTGAQEIASPGDTQLTGIAVVPGLEIEVDIKPGSNANLFVPRGRGLAAVAILGSDIFDVKDVDGATLAFGPDGAQPVFDLTNPWVFFFSRRDVNRDGTKDLISFYRPRETGIAFGDTQACLSAETRDGTPLMGCDSITTLPHCGHGFEAALVLPPLVWIGARKRRRRLE